MAPMALDSSLPNSNVYAYSSSNTQFLKHLICAPRHKYLVSDLEQERSWEREEKKKKKRKKYLVKKEKKSSRTHKREKSKLLKPSFMFSLITLNISLFCNPKKKNSNLFPCIKPNTLPLYSHPMCFCRIAGLIFLLYINTSLLKVLFC